MPDKYVLKYQDFDGDPQTTSINVQDVDDAVDFPTWRGQLNNLGVFMDSWGAGRNAFGGYNVTDVDNGPGAAATPIAQKSTQLILETQDTVTGVIYRERLPMPDLAKADDAGGDPAWIAVGQGANSLTRMNPDHEDFASLKAAYDLVGRSPEDNPAVLVGGYIEE